VLELDPNGKPTIVTEYKYSATGKLIQVTQHGHDGDIPRVRDFVYDGQDRLISESSPEGGTVTYTYNNSSIASMKDARGITTTYIRDDNGRLICKQYSNGDPSAVYVYDGASGNLTSSYLESPKGRFGERTYHYNALGKLDRVTQKINAIHTLSFDYDASGRLTEITYSDGRVVHQTWDSNNHISSIEDQNGTAYFSELQYDTNGELNGGHFGDNLTADFNYTSNGYIELLRIDRADKTILNKSYTYTADGSISKISDALRPKGGFSYRYDDLQRVAGYTRLDGEHEHSYNYDAFGNLSIDASSPYTYTAKNRIPPMTGIAYDASGDMTNDGRHSYQYDAEGRISQVDDGSVEYLYSAENDRIQKRVGKDITETIWVGDDPLAELKPDGTWVDYLYVDGRRIAAIRKSDITYYVSDPLGTTRMELSSSGEILAQSDMTPFGQLINRHSDAEVVPFTGGEQYDVETGLSSYKYRSYNPLLGRWMSADPSNEEYATLGNPQSLNLYSYVINDPLKYVDPLGLAGSSEGSCGCPGGTTFPTHDANHTHTLVVREVNGQDSNWGNHITVQIDGGQEVGFDPVSGVAAILGGDTPGVVLLRNPNEPTLDAVTYYLTDDQANNAQQYISAFQNSTPDYNISEYNCVNFAENTMAAANITPPNDELPDALIKDIRNNQCSSGSNQSPE
jgi:RHS repeat-associated protein